MRSIPLVFLGLLAVGYAASNRDVSYGEPTTAPSSRPVAFGFGPMTYFEDKCSNCHGPYGSAYGAEFGRKLSEEELVRVVDDMCSGPGNAPVNSDQLKVLVNYHKALIAKKPFLLVTESTSKEGNQILKGEATPKSTVTVGTHEAKVDGHVWTAEVPKADRYDITAKLGAAKTSIGFTTP